jgi:hypothetical protein
MEVGEGRDSRVSEEFLQKSKSPAVWRGHELSVLGETEISLRLGARGKLAAKHTSNRH